MNIHRLLLTFDRADFPGEVGKNLKILLDNNLIIPDKLLDNNTPLTYKSTESGALFLKNNFNENQMMSYIKGMEDPSLLLEIVKAIIDREKN